MPIKSFTILIHITYQDIQKYELQRCCDTMHSIFDGVDMWTYSWNHHLLSL